MFVIVFFVCVHMNCSGSRISIPFSTTVALYRNTNLLFVVASASHYSISIALCCVSTIVYTSMVCCTFNYTSMDSYSSFVTFFLASFCIIYASTKWCSLALSSFDSSMHIGFIDVTYGPVYSLTCQCRLPLHKNSIVDVLIISMFWIIICTNYILSLYAFPSRHSKDDDEYVNDLTTNSWIFNTPSFSAFLNSFSTCVIHKSSTSSSYLHLCSLLYASFSLVISCSFTIPLSPLIVLWIPKLWKHS